MVAQGAWAQPVDRSQALERARQFMYEKGRQISEQNHPARAAAAGDMAQPAFYVFNADQQQGFVIISGDDRLRADMPSSSAVTTRRTSSTLTGDGAVLPTKHRTTAGSIVSTHCSPPIKV